MTQTAGSGIYTLDQRWQATTQPVVLTGLQSVVRMLIEQAQQDRRRGHRTATFMSGYQGSPLAGLDRAVKSAADAIAAHQVHLVPGVNEELAATAVWGSQMPLGALRGVDGVVGVWYGKAPGLDRAGDALRHANMMGAHPAGGVLALVGDDPTCKSSTLPSASERTLAALDLPVLFPRDAADVIRLGQWGIALSRASGCWVGIKINSDVADGLWTVENEPRTDTLAAPALDWDGRPWAYKQHRMPAPPLSLTAEAELTGPRWAMVHAFAAMNEVDEIRNETADAWLCILAVGTASRTVEQALEVLRLDTIDLDRAGIRIANIQLPYPLSSAFALRATAGTSHVLVVEDKAPLVEDQLRAMLYGRRDAPCIVGKNDEDGRRLLAAHGELTAEQVTAALRRTLKERIELPEPPAPRTQLTLLTTRRSAYFCSGCPHNRSTVVPTGSLAGGGIGCHAMVAMMPRPESKIVGLTQMGGEGAQWIGQAAYAEVPHVFQNMGDGTYFHSGQLAVQACVAAGVNITFKILYNGTVAMTGGQDAQGAIGVPALARKLTAEGVRRIVICTDDPNKYRRRSGLPQGVPVWHRDRLDEAQRMLRDTSGVTVLIYDQQCAAEARRLRKRGLAPKPRRRILINEAVCEGCGDCGRKSNCLSVEPVDTPLGRKTRIDQSSCNSDYSCLDGDCPSFVTIETDGSPARPTSVEAPTCPEPQLADADDFAVFLAGIGGTGIVTVNQILATAATLQGLHAHGLDQTGLSQKAGPVTSHLRFTARSVTAANRVDAGGAGCYLAFDALVGADSRHLDVADPARTVAIVSTSYQPTGDMVADSSVPAVPMDEMLARIRDRSRSLIAVDTLESSRQLFGGTLPSNMLVVGAAYQAGALPVASTHLEEAIRINGVAVDLNIAAFRWGRAVVAAPELFAAATKAGDAPPSRVMAPPLDLGDSPLAGQVRELVSALAGDVRRYQGRGAAVDYAEFVAKVWLGERAVGDSIDLSLAVARGLHHVTAYKDEYEVAGLLSDPAFRRWVAAEYPDAVRFRYRLHPPLLRSLGWRNKIALSDRWTPLLRLLARLKFLRATPFDPFGHTRTRRTERRLIADYRSLIEQELSFLTMDRYPRAVELANLVLDVRGYEGIKLDRIGEFYARVAQLQSQSGSIGHDQEESA